MFVVTHPLLGDFRVTRVLGEGTYAVAYLAENIKDDYELCIKMSTSDDIEKEFILNRKIQHPLVVDSYDIFSFNGVKCVIMEVVNGISLRDYLNNAVCFNEDDARRIFTELTLVLKHLHENENIIHRDLKCENVLIDNNRNIKLIDFGLASDKENLMKTKCGSPYYIAPEVISSDKYDRSVDIWSLGIILYAMLMKTLPFDGKNINDLINNILNVEPRYSNEINNLAVDLMKKLLKKDPKERIQINDILNHPWLHRDLKGNNLRINEGFLNECLIDEISIDKQMKIRNIHLDLIDGKERAKNEMLRRIFRRKLLVAEMNELYSCILTKHKLRNASSYTNNHGTFSDMLKAKTEPKKHARTILRRNTIKSKLVPLVQCQTFKV